MDKPLDPSVSWPPSRPSSTPPTLAETARRAESIGYSALVIPDHLIEQLSPVPAMAIIAAATKTLRIGTFVVNNDLRHPAVLAQDMASLDVLSGGRLEIGIGAGWNRPEYDAIGLPFEPVATRVERLAESVTVLKGSSATARSRSTAGTTRSPTTTASPSPSRSPIRRC